MTYIVIFGVAVAMFFFAAVVDIRLFSEIDRFERQADGVEREMEVHLDSISKLTMETARLEERINMLEEQKEELDKKLRDMEENVAANVAKKVEQRWDAGLEKMMAWNPYDVGDEGGGN